MIGFKIPYTEWPSLLRNSNHSVFVVNQVPFLRTSEL